MNKQEFIDNCKSISIDITNEIYNKLYFYFESLVEWNNKFNMTTILEEKDVFLLHFYDSLCLIKAIQLNSVESLCDFGTGAGFPGLVLAIVFENINVTLIESNAKKCSFLEYIKKKLNLKNVEIINSRVEEYSRKNREKFDVVTCRAVTSIPIILELSTSLVKVNGYLSPLKSNCDEELLKYKYLLKELDLEMTKKITYNLPINNAFRTIPVFKKNKKTNIKYPENYAKIVKKYK